VFGRSKTSSDPAQAAGARAAEPAREGAKGRPTPKRREAQQRNRTPLGSKTMAGAARPGATKEEKKAARAEQRTAMAEERARTRQALITGDERHLPARDKGPARRFVRDYVDARRNVGEMFIPAALVILGASLIPNQYVIVGSLVSLYGLVLLVVLDSLWLRRTLKRVTVETFGDKAQGAPGYGVMRALQIRRTRLPRPQTQRGQYPS
jgi:hypothetical protein